MFDRILLALDDPDDQETALPLLRRLARAAGSRMIVMQSVPFLETIAEMPHELSPEITGDDEAAEVSVGAVVEGLRSDGFPADGFTNVGRSAMMVAAAAERVEASLIVLAARPRPRFVRTLLRLTSIPVFVVPRATRSSGRPARILVPVDESEESLEVLPFAAALARWFKTGLAIVHVGASDSAAVRANDLALRQAVPTEIIVRRGDPAAGILEVCRDLPAGMIAMRTRARRERSSVTLQVLPSSPVPLLVVQGPPGPAPGRPAILIPPRAIPVPVALWHRRVSSNPLQGVGEP